MGVVHGRGDVRVRLGLSLLTQIVQLKEQALVRNLHIIPLLLQRADFLGRLAPLRLLFEHGLEALPHNVVFMLQAAHVALHVRQLVLVWLHRHLAEVLQRLQHNVMTMFGSTRLVEKIPQLHRNVVRILLLLRPLASIVSSWGRRIRAVRRDLKLLRRWFALRWASCRQARRFILSLCRRN